MVCFLVETITKMLHGSQSDVQFYESDLRGLWLKYWIDVFVASTFLCKKRSQWLSEIENEKQKSSSCFTPNSQFKLSTF